MNAFVFNRSLRYYLKINECITFEIRQLDVLNEIRNFGEKLFAVPLGEIQNEKSTDDRNALLRPTLQTVYPIQQVSFSFELMAGFAIKYFSFQSAIKRQRERFFRRGRIEVEKEERKQFVAG